MQSGAHSQRGRPPSMRQALPGPHSTPSHESVDRGHARVGCGAWLRPEVLRGPAPSLPVPTDKGRTGVRRSPKKGPTEGGELIWGLGEFQPLRGGLVLDAFRGTGLCQGAGLRVGESEGSLLGIWGSGKNRLHPQSCSRSAAGPPAQADVCSLIYARFWEGRRGTGCVSPGGSTPSRRGAGEDGQRLFLAPARTSPEEASGRAGRWPGLRFIS